MRRWLLFISGLVLYPAFPILAIEAGSGARVAALVLPVILAIFFLVFFIFLFAYRAENPPRSRKGHRDLFAAADPVGDSEVSGHPGDRLEEETMLWKSGASDSAGAQENWNLPGFHAIPSFLGAPEPPGSGFDFRWYRFAEMPRDPAFFLDLESFAREFLKSLSAIVQGGKCILFLVTGSGQYRAVLQLSGKLVISGAALDAKEPEESVLRQLRTGKTVLMENGRSLYFPLESRSGLLGALFLETEHSLYNSELVSYAWTEVKKFSDFLYQAKIYEQANTDPESTLAGGLRFHEDLVKTLARKKSYKTAPSLYLIQLKNEDTHRMNLAGPILREQGPEEFGFYRIADNVIGIIGFTLSDRDLEYFFNDLHEFFSRSLIGLEGIGGADLGFDVPGPSEWFRRAGLSLEESLRTDGEAVIYRDTVRNLVRIKVTRSKVNT